MTNWTVQIVTTQIEIKKTSTGSAQGIATIANQVVYVCCICCVYIVAGSAHVGQHNVDSVNRTTRCPSYLEPGL